MSEGLARDPRDGPHDPGGWRGDGHWRSGGAAAARAEPGDVCQGHRADSPAVLPELSQLYRRNRSDAVDHLRRSAALGEVHQAENRPARNAAVVYRKEYRHPEV